MEDISSVPVVFETASFVATPCVDCDVPGYLVLRAIEKKASISAMSSGALEELGNTLAVLERAIAKVTSAEHVYVLRFSEGLASVHFHLFPRTLELAQGWLISNEMPQSGNINGPLLFAWARIERYVKSAELLSQTTLETSLRIKSFIAKDRSSSLHSEKADLDLAGEDC